MLPQSVLLALVAAVSAVPLNINLGAYSPALVVGDGEISLGSTGEASTLMSTLASGAAQQGAAGGAAAGQPPRENAAAENPPAAAEQAQEPPAEGGAAGGAAEKRGNVRRALESFFKRAPTPEAEKLAAYEDAMHWIKRDLAGFNAALSYAREAMKDQPKIEMGSEGAGVGIVVNPGINVPANSAAAGAPKAEKRSEVVDDEETPKMTLVAITEV